MARSPFLQITIYAIDYNDVCLEGFWKASQRGHTLGPCCHARQGPHYWVMVSGAEGWPWCDQVGVEKPGDSFESSTRNGFWLALSIDIFQCRHPKTPLIFPELPKSHLKAAWTWWWALAISCSLAHDRMGWVRDCHKRGVLSNRDIIRDDQEMISMSHVSYIVTMQRKQREQRESGFPKRHHFFHLSLHTSDVSKALQLWCDFAGAHRLWVWRLHACGYTLWGVNCVHRSLTRNAMCQNM